MHPARDLGSIELWERSLARARQRRRLAEVGRRARRKRKSVSLAVSAALVAAPVLPRLSAAAAAGSGSAVSGSVDTGSRSLLDASGGPVVLRVGSEGGLVVAAQRRLNEVVPLTYLRVDGMFGALTRVAVVDFQRRHGLPPTGSIDARTWALLFDAPVLLLSQDGAPAAGGPGASVAEYNSAVVPRSSSGSSAGARLGTPAVPVVGGSAPAVGVCKPAGTGSAAAGADGAAAAPSSQGSDSQAGQGSGSGTGQGSASGTGQGRAANNGASNPPSGPVGGAPAGSGGSPSVGVVAPSTPSSQPSTYVLTNGVALPLPRNYIVNGYVDQGVDYSAPGGTPLYAMGDGVIIGEGISGFGPNAPILQITSGPLKGLEVYYGHAGPDTVQVGQRVHAGQQISEVGYGIVGISTGPHLEIGVYPPGPMGAGSRMLAIINGLLSAHPTGRAWGTTASAARV
ncbi:MAG TPA: peptidoglycan-binding protein, partial [Solirubrobacteraceae bacterium]|nr:peptidoglycan-binding protein [Solirubrobacteraceae bacterium]